MAKKNEEEITREDVKTADVVYDLSSLYEMRFRDPVTGSVVMVRKAYKPRGKLEFYTPKQD